MSRYRFPAVLTLALASGIAILALPAAAQSQSASATVAQVESRQVPSAVASPSPKRGIREHVKAALSKMNPARLIREREYQKALAAFPEFCKRWEHLLHEREVNNLNHIEWKPGNGSEDGTYTGYSRIDSCTCKKSPDGFAIGRLTYKEFKYYVAGKSRAEAEHSKPAVSEVTPTTELFRWDRGKWFY